MKTTSRYHHAPRLAARLARVALVLGLVAGAVLPASAADVSLEDALAEPLPLRDYNLRLDLGSARLEQVQASGAVSEALATATTCAAAPGPGLWLVVASERGDSLALLPLGANRATAQAVASTAACNSSAAPALNLSAEAIARVVARGGGVLYVDAGSSAMPSGPVVARGGAQ